MTIVKNYSRPVDAIQDFCPRCRKRIEGKCTPRCEVNPYNWKLYQATPPDIPIYKLTRIRDIIFAKRYPNISGILQRKDLL